MSIRTRIIALAAALILVEIASYWKLVHALQWGNENWLAFTTGLALIGLLLSAIVALGSPSVPAKMRRHIFHAGIWLFATQALANVLIAYQYGLTAMPVAVVTRFFNISEEMALHGMAIIEGATLSIVSISFWNVIGELLRNYLEERQQRQMNLRELEQLLRESANA